MKPIKVITIYRTQSDECYFETSEVEEVKEKGFVAKEPVPMSKNDMLCFTDALRKSSISIKIKEDLFDKVFSVNMGNLIFNGISAETLEMVWWTPAGKKMMFFSETLSIKTGEYHLPHLVWKYNKGELSVYACFDPYPELESKLYLTPFMNVNQGKVCLGTSKTNLHKAGSVKEAKSNIVKGFFDSQFTHFWGASNFKKKIDPNKTYEKMKKEAPSSDDLIETSLTISKLCML